MIVLFSFLPLFQIGTSSDRNTYGGIQVSTRTAVLLLSLERGRNIRQLPTEGGVSCYNRASNHTRERESNKKLLEENDKMIVCRSGSTCRRTPSPFMDAISSPNPHNNNDEAFSGGVI